MVGYGETNVCVINLHTYETEEFNLDLVVYEKIYHLRIASSNETTFNCHVAAKKRGMKQICLVDINDSFLYPKT